MIEEPFNICRLNESGKIISETKITSTEDYNNWVMERNANDNMIEYKENLLDTLQNPIEDEEDIRVIH